MIRRFHFKKRMLDRLLKKLCLFILNSSYMILLICIFRWHKVTDEEICDPMEKI